MLDRMGFELEVEVVSFASAVAGVPATRVFELMRLSGEFHARLVRAQAHCRTLLNEVPQDETRLLAARLGVAQARLRCAEVEAELEALEVGFESDSD